MADGGRFVVRGGFHTPAWSCHTHSRAKWNSFFFFALQVTEGIDLRHLDILDFTLSIDVSDLLTFTDHTILQASDGDLPTQGLYSSVLTNICVGASRLIRVREYG
jgi:hypothetical protein